MNLKRDFKTFLQDSRDLINNRDWNSLYDSLKYISSASISILTEMLLAVGIDPAETLKIIPQGYLSQSEKVKEFAPKKSIFNIIGNYAFLECESLEKVILPNTLEYIGRNAFMDCINLKYLELPKSLVAIDTYTFFNCSKLTTIVYNGTVEEWSKVRKGTDSTYHKVPCRKIKCLDGYARLRG